MQTLYKQEGLFLFLRLSGKFPRGTVNEGSSIVAAVVQAGPWPGNAMGMAKKKGERKEECLYTICKRVPPNRRVWHFNKDHVGSDGFPSW